MCVCAQDIIIIACNSGPRPRGSIVGALYCGELIQEAEVEEEEDLLWARRRSSGAGGGNFK